MQESIDALPIVRRRAAAVAVVWAVVGVVLSAGLPGLFLRLKGGGFEDNEHYMDCLRFQKYRKF